MSFILREERATYVVHVPAHTATKTRTKDEKIRMVVKNFDAAVMAVAPFAAVFVSLSVR